MRRAWIISTGTELTLGQAVGTNAAWLAAQMAELGIRTERHVTIPDDEIAACEVLLQAAGACDVILITGGLGPTADDLTRSALAQAAGVPLELHAPSLEHLRAFFAARGREMPPANRVQALVPRGAGVLRNRCGTAPGLRVELQRTPCYALPGVPFEMRNMFAHEVAPELRAANHDAVLLSRRLHTCGLGEADIGMRISDLMQRGRNPEVGTTASFGIVSVRINAAAPTRAAAEVQLQAEEAELRRRLGPAVFGRDEDTLASVVGRLLASAGQTLCTAESCTGGMIGTLVTDVPGSSQYFRGGIIAYADAVKEGVLGVQRADLEAHGAVSEAVARQMADTAVSLFGSDYAIAVTGVAGPAGGTERKPVGLVFIGLRTPAETTVHEFRFGSDSPREAVRIRSSWTALNLLRLSLQGAPPART